MQFVRSSFVASSRCELARSVNAGVFRGSGECAVVVGRGRRGDRAAAGHRRRVAHHQPADGVVLRAARLGRARDRRPADRGRRPVAAAAAARRPRLGGRQRWRSVHQRRGQRMFPADIRHRRRLRRRGPPGQDGAGRRRNRVAAVERRRCVTRRRTVTLCTAGM